MTSSKPRETVERMIDFGQTANWSKVHIVLRVDQTAMMFNIGQTLPRRSDIMLG
jgi:hypothetical protein